MSIDAMKQALEALERGETKLRYEAITALRAAIEQTNDWDEVEALRASLREHMAEIHRLRAAIEQAQEPVAWMHNLIEGNVITHRPADIDRHPERWTALYTAPPPCPTCEALARSVMMDQTSHDIAPRQWQGLTDAERGITAAETWGSVLIAPQSYQAFARAIEAKLKTKNA